jgi:hypothetical protein
MMKTNNKENKKENLASVSARLAAAIVVSAVFLSGCGDTETGISSTASSSAAETTVSQASDTEQSSASETLTASTESAETSSATPAADAQVQELNDGDNTISWSDGTSDTITRTVTADTSDPNEYTALELTVNGKTYKTDLDYSFEVKAYAADINSSDSVKNIIVSCMYEDDYRMWRILSYDASGIKTVQDETGGILDTDTLKSDGTFTVYSDTANWAVPESNSPMLSTVYSLDGDKITSVSQKIIHDANTNGTDPDYKDGFEFTTAADIQYYGDSACSSAAGTIPAGTTVDITGYEYDKNADGYSLQNKYQISFDGKTGWVTLQTLEGDDPSNPPVKGFYEFG